MTHHSTHARRSGGQSSERPVAPGSSRSRRVATVGAQSAAGRDGRRARWTSAPTAAWPPVITATWLRVRGPPWVPRSVPISSKPNARPAADHARQHSRPGSATGNGAVPSTPSTSVSHARASCAPAPQTTVALPSGARTGRRRAGRAPDAGRSAAGRRAPPGRGRRRRSTRCRPSRGGRAPRPGARRSRGSTASAASLSGPCTWAAVSGAFSWLTTRSGPASSAASSSTMVSRSST